MTAPSPANPLALTFILLTVGLDAIGIGLIFPVMPDLMMEVTGKTLSEAALWGGAITAAFAVMQFLCGPVVGNLSDRFGRRPVLLVSMSVMALDYVVMGVTGSVWVLLAARTVSGVTAATHSTANAYIADITPADQRAKRFGLIGAAFGVGFVLGPILGGLLAGIDTRAPFWAAAALAAMNAIFGFLVLPESLSVADRRAFGWARANPLSSFAAIRHLPGLRALLVVAFVYALTFTVYPAVWSYFGKAAFGWSAGMVGVSLAAYGLALALVQAFLVAPSIRLFGERRAVVIGMWIEVGAFVFLGLTTSGMLTLMLTPITALGGIAGPALQSLQSRQVPASQQGELQGILTSLNALTMIIGPLVMTSVFGFFTGPAAPVVLPGAPFLLAALLMVAAVLVFVAGSRERSAS
ncbi:MAG: TCR/Tet family MFS transporter [Rhodobacteraceae bacterium]|nr:TCR/Tet family MFS transporter [Paracoccaceae bacterium]